VKSIYISYLKPERSFVFSPYHFSIIEMVDSALLAEEQLLETILTDKSYWRRLCPFLEVGNGGLEVEGDDGVEVDEDWARMKKEEFVSNGFFYLCEEDVGATKDEVERLARGVEALLAYGWPPSFIFVYDEAWHVIERLTKKVKAASRGSEFIGDIYAWHVDPGKGEAGWGPHRDRMGSGPESFREDGTPMLSTTWLALSDASPHNSCLHVIPATEDPYYKTADDPTVDPLGAIFEGNPCAFQSIRALPCPKGAAWHFSHKIIHWGSHVKRRSSLGGQKLIPPRIAMSWVIGDSSFESFAFDKKNLPKPNLQLRVGFVAAQIIAYGGQTSIRKGFRNLCFRLFKATAHQFTEFYKDKVEYIHFCRPAPPAKIELKETTRAFVKKTIEDLEFASPEDDGKLDGIKGMFGGDESSSEDDVEEEERT